MALAALLCSVGFKTQGTLLLMADDAIDDAKLSYTIACLETLVESKTGALHGDVAASSGGWWSLTGLDCCLFLQLLTALRRRRSARPGKRS